MRIFCYGIASNTAEQFRRVFDHPEVRRFLEARYERRTIGSYTLWIRREGP